MALSLRIAKPDRLLRPLRTHRARCGALNSQKSEMLLKRENVELVGDRRLHCAAGVLSICDNAHQIHLGGRGRAKRSCPNPATTGATARADSHFFGSPTAGNTSQNFVVLS